MASGRADNPALGRTDVSERAPTCAQGPQRSAGRRPPSDPNRPLCRAICSVGTILVLGSTQPSGHVRSLVRRVNTAMSILLTQLFKAAERIILYRERILFGFNSFLRVTIRVSEGDLVRSTVHARSRQDTISLTLLTRLMVSVIQTLRLGRKVGLMRLELSRSLFSSSAGTSGAT